MKEYLITESVSGESKFIKAEDPIKALIKYLEDETISLHRESWNFDFEIKEIVWR